MSESGARSGRVVAWVAALSVLLLAGAATWWPRPVHRTTGPVVVVLDPTGDERRVAVTWPALGRVLATMSSEPTRVLVARTRAEFRELVRAGPDFVVCPDGEALGLETSAWVPVAAGRRAAPRNLRPRGVLVSRADVAVDEAPWLTHPGSVIFGDSLSLTATGVLRAAGGTLPTMTAQEGWGEAGRGQAGRGQEGRGQAGWGPDPYDHSAALHALRLGAYQHAVVRQWDAERFRAQGLLDDSVWRLRDLTVPVPDLVVLADRRMPAAERLALGERLAGIGRELADLTPAERELAAALPFLGLAGFNLLLEPDFELVRSNFAAGWPRPRP